MVTRRQFGIASLGFLAGCGEPGSSSSRRFDLLPTPAEPPVPFAVGSGSNAFGWDLYQQLRGQPGDVFVSPCSAHTALAMTAAGAKANTLAEMTKVLHLGGKPNIVTARDVQLTNANAIWAQKGVNWEPEFQRVLAEEFLAAANDADFVADADAERLRINAWVEENTRNRIRELLARGMVDAMTRLVLVNAIYFKGDWAEAFKKNVTQDKPFTKLDGSTPTVPLMNRRDEMAYAETETAQVVRVPYKGNDMSFVAVLPKSNDQFAALEAGMTDSTWTTWMKSLTTHSVELYLPRFKIETTMPLNERLQAMGMAGAFDPEKADFSGMTRMRLFISLVIQKAFVEVNEEGTEAAAATAVVMARPTSARVYPKFVTFRADRPFLFAIRHDPSSTLLFLGRYTGPQ